MSKKYLVLSILFLLSLSVIVVYLAGPVFIWGEPLTEERESSVELADLESSIIDFEKSIMSVSQSGQGAAREVSLDLDKGSLTLNESEEYVQISLPVSETPYQNEWEFLKGQSLQGLSIGAGEYGIRGKHSPSVVAVKYDKGSVKYRVEFRKLRSSTGATSRLQGVDLQASGSTEAEGNINLEVENAGRVSENYTLQNGEDVNLISTVVQIDLVSQ